VGEKLEGHRAKTRYDTDQASQEDNPADRTKMPAISGP